MKLWKFKGLFNSGQWFEPAFVVTDVRGVITYISQEKPKVAVSDVEDLDAWALPGFVNAHSHAFQYAMAGLNELGDKQNSFWTWRKHMYKLALQLTPDQLLVIAESLYGEMLAHGYVHTVEFHYLHHNHDGTSFDNPTLMSEVLIEAAERVGMGLTLIPVYYNQGGFGKSHEDTQRRFIFTSPAEYFKFCENLKSKTKAKDYLLGHGIHSLRASSIIDTQVILKQLGSATPFHIHISEQIKEVDEAIIHLKMRPVAWLLGQQTESENINLVHATHIDDFELRGIQQKNWNVVLCPSTEANLADGFFPIKSHHSTGGQWTIGTDSHVGLSPTEELRWLDYGERLKSNSRTPLVSTGNKESGAESFQAAIEGGRTSAGLKKQAFQIGEPLTAILLDGADPFLQSPNSLLSRWIYSPAGQSKVWGLLKSGQWIIKERQRKASPPSEVFRALMNSLVL